jgi:hypothetical protein
MRLWSCYTGCLAFRFSKFTSDAIYDELSDYTINQNSRDDELDEIGGSHVSVDGITDVEIVSVRRSGSNFIVEGSGRSVSSCWIR